MRLGLLYETIKEPWGGVNTFFRNFASCAEKSDEVELTNNFKNAAVILSAGHYYAPGCLLKRYQLRNLSHGKRMYNPLGLLPKRGSKKIVFRVDGLRKIYAKQSSKADEILIGNLCLADSVVFQSLFSQECFDNLRIDYSKFNRIIFNGANTDNFFPARKIPDFSQGIILISNSWSPNPQKGFETIALFSELANVTVLHIGRWPKQISNKAVKLLGTMRENQIAQILRKGHFFLFPSEHEACPNTVVEALATGIPVLYHNSGGTPELCRHGLFGMPIPPAPINARILQSFMQKALERHLYMRGSILEHLHTFRFAHCFNQYIQHFKQVLSF